LRYGVCPDNLTDDEWFNLYASYKFVEKLEFENQKAAIISALAEIINQVTNNIEN